MKFSFSSEQEEFRTNLQRFLTDRSPTKEVRRLMETEAGWERDAWRALNEELGLTATRIPEEPMSIAERQTPGLLQQRPAVTSEPVNQ